MNIRPNLIVTASIGLLFSMPLTAQESVVPDKSGDPSKNYFVFYGEREDNSHQLRLDNRAKHIEWVKNTPIRVAGPIKDEKGNYAGAVIIFEASNLAAAKAHFETDPYIKAGVFSSYKIMSWDWIIGAPGGKSMKEINFNVSKTSEPNSKKK